MSMLARQSQIVRRLVSDGSRLLSSSKAQPTLCSTSNGLHSMTSAPTLGGSTTVLSTNNTIWQIQQNRWKKMYMRPKEWKQMTKVEVEERLFKAITGFERYPKAQEKQQQMTGKRCLHLSARVGMEKFPMDIKTVEERIILVLSLYDKIDPSKLTMDTNLMTDLGLDSLDHVEIMMAIEDEFSFEIPDGDAERLVTPRLIFQYIVDKEDVFE